MKRPDLTVDERYLIHNAVLGGLATSEIGRMLRRHRSCIDMELKRGRVRSRYCPHAAQGRCDKARLRCGRNAPGKDAVLWQDVKASLNRERAEEANLRIEFGHVEADSMHGKKSDDKQVIVIVERQSLFTTLLLVTRRSAKRIARQIKTRLQTWGLPFLSVTTDRGWEFSAMGDIFDGQAYVCDPHQPNQRGTNEIRSGAYASSYQWASA